MVVRRFDVGLRGRRLGDRAAGPIPVDTVPFGCFEKCLGEALGGFNERLRTNEDYEFNYRVRGSGRMVLLDPGVVCMYVARDTLSRLPGQYWRYGWWKAEMLRRRPRALRWRQAIPMLFVGAAGALGMLAILERAFAPWLAALGAAYALTVSLGSVHVTWRRRTWQVLPALPLVFATIHFTWGTGALINFLTLGRWPRWR